MKALGLKISLRVSVGVTVKEARERGGGTELCLFPLLFESS